MNEWATAVVAAYAAALATWQYIASKRQQRRERKREVKVRVFFAPAGVNGESGALQFALYARAVSTGRRPVSLRGPLFVVGGKPYAGANLFHGGAGLSFPHELTEGREVTIRVNAEPMAAGLEQSGTTGQVEFVAELTDTLDSRYASEATPVSAAMLRQLLP